MSRDYLVCQNFACKVEGLGGYRYRVRILAELLGFVLIPAESMMNLLGRFAQRLSHSIFKQVFQEQNIPWLI